MLLFCDIVISTGEQQGQLTGPGQQVYVWGCSSLSQSCEGCLIFKVEVGSRKKQNLTLTSFGM